MKIKKELSPNRQNENSLTAISLTSLDKILESPTVSKAITPKPISLRALTSRSSRGFHVSSVISNSEELRTRLDPSSDIEEIVGKLHNNKRSYTNIKKDSFSQLINTTRTITQNTENIQNGQVYLTKLQKQIAGLENLLKRVKDMPSKYIVALNSFDHKQLCRLSLLSVEASEIALMKVLERLDNPDISEPDRFRQKVYTDINTLIKNKNIDLELLENSKLSLSGISGLIPDKIVPNILSHKSISDQLQGFSAQCTNLTRTNKESSYNKVQLNNIKSPISQLVEKSDTRYNQKILSPLQNNLLDKNNVENPDTYIKKHSNKVVSIDEPENYIKKRKKNREKSLKVQDKNSSGIIYDNITLSPNALNNINSESQENQSNIDNFQTFNCRKFETTNTPANSFSKGTYDNCKSISKTYQTNTTPNTTILKENISSTQSEKNNLLNQLNISSQNEKNNMIKALSSKCEELKEKNETLEQKLSMVEIQYSEYKYAFRRLRKELKKKISHIAKYNLTANGIYLLGSDSNGKIISLDNSKTKPNEEKQLVNKDLIQEINLLKYKSYNDDNNSIIKNTIPSPKNKSHSRNRSNTHKDKSSKKRSDISPNVTSDESIKKPNSKHNDFILLHEENSKQMSEKELLEYNESTNISGENLSNIDLLISDMNSKNEVCLNNDSKNKDTEFIVENNFCDSSSSTSKRDECISKDFINSNCENMTFEDNEFEHKSTFLKIGQDEIIENNNDERVNSEIEFTENESNILTEYGVNTQVNNSSKCLKVDIQKVKTPKNVSKIFLSSDIPKLNNTNFIDSNIKLDIDKVSNISDIDMNKVKNISSENISSSEYLNDYNNPLENEIPTKNIDLINKTLEMHSPSQSNKSHLNSKKNDKKSLKQKKSIKLENNIPEIKSQTIYKKDPYISNHSEFNNNILNNNDSNKHGDIIFLKLQLATKQAKIDSLTSELTDKIQIINCKDRKITILNNENKKLTEKQNSAMLKLKMCAEKVRSVEKLVKTFFLNNSTETSNYRQIPDNEDDQKDDDIYKKLQISITQFAEKVEKTLNIQKHNLCITLRKLEKITQLISGFVENNKFRRDPAITGNIILGGLPTLQSYEYDFTNLVLDAKSFDINQEDSCVSDVLEDCKKLSNTNHGIYSSNSVNRVMESVKFAQLFGKYLINTENGYEFQKWWNKFCIKYLKFDSEIDYVNVCCAVPYVLQSLLQFVYQRFPMQIIVSKNYIESNSSIHCLSSLFSDTKRISLLNLWGNETKIQNLQYTLDAIVDSIAQNQCEQHKLEFRKLYKKASKNKENFDNKDTLTSNSLNNDIIKTKRLDLVEENKNDISQNINKFYYPANSYLTKNLIQVDTILKTEYNIDQDDHNGLLAIYSPIKKDPFLNSLNTKEYHIQSKIDKFRERPLAIKTGNDLQKRANLLNLNKDTEILDYLLYDKCSESVSSAEYQKSLKPLYSVMMNLTKNNLDSVSESITPIAGDISPIIYRSKQKTFNMINLDLDMQKEYDDNINMVLFEQRKAYWNSLYKSTLSTNSKNFALIPNLTTDYQGSSNVSSTKIELESDESILNNQDSWTTLLYEYSQVVNYLPISSIIEPVITEI